MTVKDRVLEQFINDLSQSSDHVRHDRSFYARMFLDFVGDKPLSEWNKYIVMSFLADLEDKGYAPGTVRKVYGIVKRVFDAAKAVYEQERTVRIRRVDAHKPGAVAEVLQALSLPGPNWDLGKRSEPTVDTEDMLRPALTLEEIALAVDAAKSGKLSQGDCAYLSLSSVYGLRREELCRIQPEHVDIKGHQIYVLTAKGGEKRNQYLADELIPYIEGYDFPPYSVSRMSEVFYRICYRSGIQHREGMGFHSFRRYLDTALVKAFGELAAHIFLRWKLSSSDMTAR